MSLFLAYIYANIRFSHDAANLVLNSLSSICNYTGGNGQPLCSAALKIFLF